MTTTTKITFPVVGKVHGETIRRNAETGVEIRSSKLDRGGMEHSVYVPDAEHGYRLSDYFGELTSAREEAADRVVYLRETIAAAYTEAYAEADRIERADADAEDAVEATSGLEVVFRPTFSAELTGVRFRIVTPEGRETVRFAAASEGGYAFVTLMTFVDANTRSGLRAAYRTAKLDDLRTVAGRRVVVEVSAPAADPEIEAEAAEASELTEYARKQFPSVAAMLDPSGMDPAYIERLGFRVRPNGIGTLWTHTLTGVMIGKFPGEAYAVTVPVKGAHVEVVAGFDEFPTFEAALDHAMTLVVRWTRRIQADAEAALVEHFERFPLVADESHVYYEGRVREVYMTGHVLLLSARNEDPDVAIRVAAEAVFPVSRTPLAPALDAEPALPQGVELIEFGAAEPSAYVYMLSGIEVADMPKMEIAKRPTERRGRGGYALAGWAVRIGTTEIDRKHTKREARARLDQWLARHLAKITKVAAEEAAPVTIRHRDEVVFATTAKDMPEPIPGATNVTPWTLDGTDDVLRAPGGRVYVHVWQSFTDPVKGFSGRLAPAWLDELRTPQGRRVTLSGL